MTIGNSNVLRDRVAKKIRDLGLVAVPVIADTDPDDSDGVLFDGSLDEFLQTILQINERVVFVASRVFSEEDFEQVLNYTGDESLEGASLRKFMKNAESVKKHVGEECELRLFTRNLAFELSFYHAEAWWSEHLANVSEAMGGLRDAVAKWRDEQKSKSENLRAKVRKGLDELIRDDHFIQLPTQRAMVAYALESVEGIESLDEDEVKSEVQRLNDKLIARGLRK